MPIPQYALDFHKWRVRYAILPVARYIIKERFVEKEGSYSFRNVFEVKVGLHNEWTAYADYNDDLKVVEGEPVVC